MTGEEAGFVVMTDSKSTCETSHFACDPGARVCWCPSEEKVKPTHTCSDLYLLQVLNQGNTIVSNIYKNLAFTDSNISLIFLVNFMQS